MTNIYFSRERTKSCVDLGAYPLAYFLKAALFVELKPPPLSLWLRYGHPGVEERCGFEVIAGLFLQLLLKLLSFHCSDIS